MYDSVLRGPLYRPMKELENSIKKKVFKIFCKVKIEALQNMKPLAVARKLRIYKILIAQG